MGRRGDCRKSRDFQLTGVIPAATALCVGFIILLYKAVLFTDSLLFIRNNSEFHDTAEILLDHEVEAYFDSLEVWRMMFNRRVDGKIYFGDKYIWDWQYGRNIAQKLDSIITEFPIATAQLRNDVRIREVWRAFSRWHHSPSAESLSYGKFKNTLLPFAQSGIYVESFERSGFFRHGYGSAEELIDSLKARKGFATFVGKYSETASTELGEYKLVYLGGWESGDCKTAAFVTNDLFHKCGIPCVIETTPAWPDRLSRHYWCSAPDSNGVFRPFTPPYNNLGEDWDEYLSCSGKIYRICYGRSRSSALDYCGKGEPIPESIDDPKLLDVTSLYHKCHNLKIPISRIPEGKLIYLSHFSPLPERYRAVGWGRFDKRSHTVSFEQVPEYKLFFPVIYSEIMPSPDSAFIPCADPFMIDSTGRVIVFKPNGNTCDISLLRKYPIKKNLSALWPSGRKVWIMACNNLSESCDTLGFFPTEQIPYMRDILIKESPNYQYYEIASEDGSYIHFGELEWYDSHRNELVPDILNKGTKLENIFDKNVETFAGHQKWVLISKNQYQ